MGLVSLANGDIAGIEPLAVKLGGFPKETEKLIQFVKILKQNKEGLNFKGVAKLAAGEAIAQGEKMAAAAVGLDNGRLQMIQDTIRQGMEDPRSIFSPQIIFRHFANSRGTMNIGDFTNIFTQLKLSVPHSRIIQMFSQADREKKGELSYLDFVKAFDRLKAYLVTQTMTTLGFSVGDLVYSFCMSILILLLMFAFIFVGIGAFSPISSFSSVTNSFLPLGAGAAVNGKSQDEQKPEDLKEAVEDSATSNN